MREASLATSWQRHSNSQRAQRDVASGRLAAAVSAGGGLGMIGVWSAGTVTYLNAEAFIGIRREPPMCTEGRSPELRSS